MPEGEKRICFLQGIREDPTKKILVLSIKGENIWPGISRIKMFLFKKTKKKHTQRKWISEPRSLEF